MRKYICRGCGKEVKRGNGVYVKYEKPNHAPQITVKREGAWCYKCWEDIKND